MGGFEDHVRAALDSLPPELARGLENVAVVVEEQNADEPDLLRPVRRAAVPAGADRDLPPAARRGLRRRPGARSSDEIRITVLHELAHYFGIDEDRLDELGYA